MKASLSPERWNQVRGLFDEVVDLEPAARAARLDEACRDDPALREEVETLVAAYGQADDLLIRLDQMVPEAAPAPRPRASRTGTRVAHYDVQEKLGAGGMGVVYKAYDTRLKRTVALKFLPPSLSRHPEAQTRFEHEAQAASTLDHPNICTIYEIGQTDDGQLFIVMACYDGQTLKQKIAQGPLPPDEALDYAIQMARGLAKAHTKGIIHRDIKPANVMVTDDGIVKILDFGLAKMIDVHLTRTGTTLGTVAYMSPEQARGEKVDHRADLWSLGVVFYEMLTGERPFNGDYEQAIMYAVLHEKPRPLTTVNPEVPVDLEHVVMMGLEKDRALRYPSMADLLADLEVFTQEAASGTATGLRATRQKRRMLRRGIGAGLGVVIMGVLLLAIPSMRKAMRAAFNQLTAPSELRLAVLPFINNLGDTPENQALADGLTQSLTSMSARIGTQAISLSVVPVDVVSRRDALSADEARMLFGVNRILRGSLQRLGSETELTLDLIDPDPATMQILDSRTIKAPLSPAFQAEVLSALEDLLGVALDDQARQVVTLGGPTEPDAYAYYLQGTGYLQRYDKAGNLDLAIQQFIQARDKDPLYALAHAGLCEATWEKYRKTTDTGLAEEALRYCDRAATLADEQAPVLITLGSIYLRTGQHDKSEAMLLRARALEPNNADALRWLGRLYEDLAQHDKAEAAYRRAIALKPSVWIYYNELAILLEFRGHWLEALEQVAYVQRLTPDNYLVYNELGNIQSRLNDVDEAERLYQHSIALHASTLAYRNLGRLYFREQQYDQAIQALEQATTMPNNDLIAWSWLGHAYYGAGNRTRADSAWHYVISQAESKLQINPRDDIMLNLLADAYAALGEREQSLRYLQRLVLLPQEEIFARYLIGRTYEILGLRDLALEWIGQVLESNFDPLVPERDPWLEDLRTDTRYQDLRSRFLSTPQPPA